MASWESSATIPLRPRCLQNKPHFFLGAVAEDRVATIVNPRYFIHSFMHACSVYLSSASYVPCYVLDAKDVKS